MLHSNYFVCQHAEPVVICSAAERHCNQVASVLGPIVSPYQEKNKMQ